MCKLITELIPNKIYKIGSTRFRFIKPEGDAALFTLFGKNRDKFGKRDQGDYYPFTYTVVIELINLNRLIS